ncbi:adenine phosphoribosyltransferase [Mycoplasma phocimorsus]|uniref:Adenine phosphoribosyltransferase n=1 Tax=Mycoplasma phocimorsus TaxID=3045839 RepID=A0AAJ1PSH3_9MOLU|nr:adenine phosphoribosyltransferase [Mycoplasma phocimorsus]MDJ1645731.1 adenine phosphoribosyltransferase [Mycoplasma phocimorsus]MDJ1646667.1 adenine phosphoribosyltransferase [Mycoplasma phocimorsus]MDJ1647289.1 adenine phosphoribosyltransferase [Mycoplasma phocimorsus]MDJ1647622.1 adenine phosphoribosyltransferase [Mycoplasma phocimorsus]MDJ1648047.1 adenine phosphoribosyltransferase [Mycoplasma phocimorsus]
MLKNNLNEYVRTVNDFPKKGIAFKDISPLLANGEALNLTVNLIAKEVEGVDAIVGPDARGFLFGTPVASLLKKPFIMVRKPNKLPGEVVSIDYSLEYGTNKLEIQKGMIKPNQKVAIIDDVLATGGTTCAIIDLLREQGAIVKKVVLVIELDDLKGRKKIEEKGVEVVSLLHY